MWSGDTSSVPGEAVGGGTRQGRDSPGGPVKPALEEPPPRQGPPRAEFWREAPSSQGGCVCARGDCELALDCPSFFLLRQADSFAGPCVEGSVGLRKVPEAETKEK